MSIMGQRRPAGAGDEADDKGETDRWVWRGWVGVTVQSALGEAAAFVVDEHCGFVFDLEKEMVSTFFDALCVTCTSYL